MPDDKFGLKGRVEFKLIRDGKIVEKREIDNLVVTAGKSEVALLLKLGTGTAFDRVWIGEGTTAATATDTALGSRVATATATATLGGSGANATFQQSYSITTSYAITESGLFNASNTMLSRTTFSAINVTNGDTLQVTWTITVS